MPRQAVQDREIEVTPEMIGAGSGELLSFFLEDIFDTPGPIVANIYRAMSRLAPQPPV